MAHYHRMLPPCLLFVHIASAFLSAAVPAPDPWRLGCPAAAPSPTVDLDPCVTSGRRCRCTGTQLIAASPQGQPGPRRGTHRGKRSRRRGCRGGARWRRPGSEGRPGELLLAQINIQSIKPKLHELRSLAHQYDIIAINETWLSPGVPPASSQHRPVPAVQTGPTCRQPPPAGERWGRRSCARLTASPCARGAGFSGVV